MEERKKRRTVKLKTKKGINLSENYSFVDKLCSKINSELMTLLCRSFNSLYLLSIAKRAKVLSFAIGLRHYC